MGIQNRMITRSTMTLLKVTSLVLLCTLAICVKAQDLEGAEHRHRKFKHVYAAPTPVYAAPAPVYGAPPKKGYGVPQAAPVYKPKHKSLFKLRKAHRAHKKHRPVYSAPAPSYGAPPAASYYSPPAPAQT